MRWPAVFSLNNYFDYFIVFVTPLRHLAPHHKKMVRQLWTFNEVSLARRMTPFIFLMQWTTRGLLLISQCWLVLCYWLVSMNLLQSRKHSALVTRSAQTSVVLVRKPPELKGTHRACTHVLRGEEDVEFSVSLVYLSIMRISKVHFQNTSRVVRTIFTLIYTVILVWSGCRATLELPYSLTRQPTEIISFTFICNWILV